MTEDQTGFDRVLAADDVEVGPADRRQRDADDGLARAGVGPLDLFDAERVHAAENARSHDVEGRTGLDAGRADFHDGVPSVQALRTGTSSSLFASALERSGHVPPCARQARGGGAP